MRRPGAPAFNRGSTVRVSRGGTVGTVADDVGGCLGLKTGPVERVWFFCCFFFWFLREKDLGISSAVTLISGTMKRHLGGGQCGLAGENYLFEFMEMLLLALETERVELRHQTSHFRDPPFPGHAAGRLLLYLPVLSLILSGM